MGLKWICVNYKFTNIAFYSFSAIKLYLYLFFICSKV
jgi:hypothetical protein